MAELGYGCIAAAFGAAVYAAVASAIGARRSAPGLVQSGRRALWLSAGLSTAAVAVLEISLYRHDFSIAYVWKTSSLTTPGLYLMTALWGGQEGSLLFWSWLLGVFLSIALARPWRADVGLLPWFAAVGAVIMSFFLGLVVFQANPFARLDVLPADGNGLNALLQHPGMAFHPPMLYLGFTGLAVPYAFAVAALITRRLDASWLSASRRWLLVAWLCLTIGLALGGRWAYDVLGWGGYWGWDPVENAALMPWLAATAFLHSIMAEERRGLFRTWNVALVLLTFCLSLIGTFLTRAGLVASVHAFAQSDIGDSFLAFTILVVAGSLALLLWRLPLLRSTVRVESVVSREAAFLGNNLLFMGALFAVFWGTTFPIISEWVTGQKVTIGPAYFNRLVLPILGAAVLLMGIGPLVAWRRADPRSVGRLLARPAFLSLALVAALVAGGCGSRRRWRASRCRRSPARRRWWRSRAAFARAGALARTSAPRSSASSPATAGATAATSSIWVSSSWRSGSRATPTRPRRRARCARAMCSRAARMRCASTASSSQASRTARSTAPGSPSCRATGRSAPSPPAGSSSATAKSSR